MKPRIKRIVEAPAAPPEGKRNQDLLKDRPETGEEGYTDNMEAVPGCPCQNRGILLLERTGEEA